MDIPPSKVGKGAGGAQLPLPSLPKTGKLEGEVTRRLQFERRPPGETSQEGQVTAPRTACGYCGRTNHTEDNYWVKGRKCFGCGSANHQISNYPRKQQ